MALKVKNRDGASNFKGSNVSLEETDLEIGVNGVGIADLKKSEVTTDGGVNRYRLILTDKREFQLNIRNGNKGADADIAGAEEAKNAANQAAENANRIVSEAVASVQSINQDENQRKANENARIASEDARNQSETDRNNNEQLRINRENTRGTSENTRLQNERNRQNAESTRQSSETTRNNQEATRQSQETSRQGNETTRQQNEEDRQTNETTRGNNETARINSETGRVNAETGRVNAENERVDSEDQREQNETTRQSNETTRQSNESVRQSNENQRQQTFETSQTQRQTAYTQAETNRNNLYTTEEGKRNKAFEDKEAVRDAANQAALDCADTLAQLGPKISGVYRVPVVENMGYDTSVTSRVPNSASAASGWNTAETAVTAGEVFKICGRGGSARRLWATLDKDRYIVRSSAASLVATTPIELTIQEGEAYLIVQYNNTYSGDWYCEMAGMQNSLSSIIKGILANTQKTFGGRVARNFVPTDTSKVYLSTDYGQYANFGLTITSASIFSYENGAWTAKTIGQPCSVFAPASSGIDGINTIIRSFPNGTTIILEDGEYSGSSAISFYDGSSNIAKNITIVGAGPNTVIKRTSGNDVVQNHANNENIVIRNLTLTTGIQRMSVANIKLIGCVVNGRYYDDSTRSVYDIRVAASNSTDSAKMNADFVCSGSADETVINNAINSLTNGGTVFLAAGTYTLSSFVNLRQKSNICLKGAGKNTVLSRASGYCIFADTAISCCISELTANISALSDTTYVFNCWNGSNFILSNPTVEKTITVPASSGIAGINSAIDAMPSEGGTIILQQGTYTGSTLISFYKSTSPAAYKPNIRIVGQGKNTIIERSTNGPEVSVSSTSVHDCIFENVSFAHSIARNGGNKPSDMVRLVNCYINDTYVNEAAEHSNAIVNIGEKYYFKNISSVYGNFYKTGWGIGKERRWELHIWGHIVENAYLVINKNYIDLIGHNALVELKGGKQEFIRFSDQTDDYYGPGLDIVVKDIHFLKTGCYAYWDSPCVTVNSDYVRFENCIFENATSTPMPYNQGDYGVGYEDGNGGRRHGIEVYCKKYNDCKTEFVNCIGIGSPYGTNSCRGFYLIIGAPKLFGCIGYGGGFGEFGHGIINHRASRAELHNCMGFAGKNSYRQAAGFRFQAFGSSQLDGCIGYPSYGEKLISNGVKASAIERICEELELDSSSYISNGVVLFDAVAANSDICAKINNDDIDLVSAGASTEESYGMSFWANSGIARLVGCKAYIGSGENSRALHCIAKSEPTIIGGYFGIEDIVSNTYYKADAGQSYMTFSPVGNPYAKYKIHKAAVSITFTPASGDKLYVETVEQTPRYIVDGFDMTGLSSIVNPTFSNIEVPAGVSLKVYVKNGNTFKTISNDSLLVHLAYNYCPTSSSALYIANDSKPTIKGAVLRNINDAITVGSGVSNIKVFDCLCEGNVDSGITFASKTAINGSSNYSI